MRKIVALCLVLILAAVAAPVSASDARSLPETIDLPDGIFPEGIASGRSSSFYVSSLSDGSIYQGDYRSGEGEFLTEPVEPFATIGLTVDNRNRVWAAGAPTGGARVYDGKSGELLASFQFTAPGESFINDVIISRNAAWFTDSGTQTDPPAEGFFFTGEPRLFKVPLKGQKLPGNDAVEELSVDVPDIAFPNLNGIEATLNGKGLIVAHTTGGAIFRVDPSSGAADQIDVGRSFTGTDGLVLDGRDLHVVENGANQVTTVRLDPDGRTGSITDEVTVPGGETPTTAALFRRGIYVVDARFASGTGPYQVTRLP